MIEIGSFEKQKIVATVEKGVNENGSCRVGWAIEKILGRGVTLTRKTKKDMAAEITSSGKYLRVPSLYGGDWIIYENPQHNTLTRVDKFNVSMGIVSFVIALVSTFISVWAIRSSELIAQKSGAFDKGKMQLSFYGYVLDPGEHYQVFYGVGEYDSTIDHIGELPFEVQNTGQKTLEEARMIIQYPNLKRIPATEEIQKYGLPYSSNVRRQIINNEPFNKAVSFELQSINPYLSVSFSEMIHLGGSRRPIPMTVTSETGEEVKDQVIINMPVQCTIALTAKDVAKETYNLSFACQDEKDINKLFMEIAHEKCAEPLPVTVTKFFVIVGIQNRLGTSDKGKKLYSVPKVFNYEVRHCVVDTERSVVVILDTKGKPVRQIKVGT